MTDSVSGARTQSQSDPLPPSAASRAVALGHVDGDSRTVIHGESRRGIGAGLHVPPRSTLPSRACTCTFIYFILHACNGSSVVWRLLVSFAAFTRQSWSTCPLGAPSGVELNQDSPKHTSVLSLRSTHTHTRSSSTQSLFYAEASIPVAGGSETDPASSTSSASQVGNKSAANDVQKARLSARRSTSACPPKRVMVRPGNIANTQRQQGRPRPATGVRTVPQAPVTQTVSIRTLGYGRHLGPQKCLVTRTLTVASVPSFFGGGGINVRLRARGELSNWQSLRGAVRILAG